MTDNVYPKPESAESRKRLRLLADLIFATAMTVMVLNIEIPIAGHITNPADLAKFLGTQLDNMWVMFIAFMVVAVYWMKHLEHYAGIGTVNQTFMWFQLLFLLAILLIPFWNTYLSLFPENIAIRVFLSANMILVGLFSYLSMNYAANPKHRLLHREVSDQKITEAKKQILTEPIIALIAAGVAFIDTLYWDLAFIMVPIFFIARKRLVKISYFKRS